MDGERNWFSFSVCMHTCVSIWDYESVLSLYHLSFRLGFQFSYLVAIFSSITFVCNIQLYLFVFSLSIRGAKTMIFKLLWFLSYMQKIFLGKFKSAFFAHGVKCSLYSVYMGYLGKLRPSWQSKTWASILFVWVGGSVLPSLLPVSGLHTHIKYSQTINSHGCW